MDIFGSSEPARILVIDDHPFSRVMAVDLLNANGYYVIEHDGVSDVFATVRNVSPDLILMDIKMPHYNGFDVCQKLKQNQDTRSIPIILMSVTDDNQSRLKSKGMMADAFMSKPLESIVLLPEVELLVQRKRLYEWLDQIQQVLFLISQAIQQRYSPEEKSEIRFDQLAQGFGKYLNLNSVEISDLILASHLHDIGTVAIPDAVIMKRGQLDEEEKELIKKHVLIGEEICKPMQNRRGIAQIIRHHHEKWDGSGYPDGLIGESIPKLAQIFQILDIYEALTSQRPYKQPYNPQEALKIISEEAEKGWRNVKLVKQFVAFMEEKELA
ncbi:HD domain-containing phosphohydrolase [Crocosphaera chwakensis]|uniref:Metal dependent phosphohydrolase, HD region with Response Regulator Receiver modulation n=1 Tax=Crocosphaera chwakensis CCY0110 TaxID=391612 RepID=A3IU82_9CHRO|nr:HD domain-containing phosphohydrolase [Crocosphaera chwakensis]EAZ89956.1 Metal dependent phosphohydrolase, HD region with Response Regulator Receiver modulation [Crocosphaera chwakensis CCY0110]